MAESEPSSASLLDAAERAVALALAAGAQDACVSAHWGRSLEMQRRDGKIEKVQESISQSLSFALYVDGRFSTHGTNDLDPARTQRFVNEAVAMTRLLEPDPFRQIPDPKGYEGRADLDLDTVDPTVRGIERREREQWLEALEGSSRTDDRVVSATASVTDGFGRTARATSNGFRGTKEGTSLWYGAECTLKEDTHKRPEAYYYAGGLHRSALPSPESVGVECLRRARARIGAKKVSSRKTALILEREAASSFVGRIFGALSAASVQQKRSFLAERQGQRIASPLLTLVDDPWIVRGPGSRLWDGEGLATRPMTVIREGVLEQYYVDTYYGRKLGWAPNTGSTSNVVFRMDPGGVERLIRDAGEGILVTSWLGGNANATTGDFSLGLRGHVVRGGDVAEPISEMNVTGNFLDLLPRITAVGDDPVPWSSFRAPSMVIDAVDFSGA